MIRRFAERAGAVIELAWAVGDTVVDGMPLLRVHGGRRPLPERELRRHVRLGTERTFEQDPKYALRLLVDIAIRALSPAINDPTTAVQALDQIEDLLLRVSALAEDLAEVAEIDLNPVVVSADGLWIGGADLSVQRFRSGPNDLRRSLD